MTAATVQPRQAPDAAAQTRDAQARVNAAIDTIVSAMGLKPAARKHLAAFVAGLASPSARFPKLPHVSFYAARTRSGGVNYRLTYRVSGYRPRTERLGKQAQPAYRRAQRVSEILQQVKARLMKADEAHRLLYVDATPIDKHIERFEAALASKGSVARYVATTITRLKVCVDLARFERMDDIRRDALPGLIGKLRSYVEPNSKRTLSESTINDYLATLRQFTRWATPALIPADPLVNSGGVRVTDRKKRRDVLVEELAAIVAAARATKARFRLRGEDRAMLYLTAYGTGLRMKELRALEVPWLKLDAEPPHIAVPAGVQKATGVAKDVKQPLPSWLAAELKRWLGDRRDGHLWPRLPRDIVDLFDRDREDARSAWIAAAPDEQARQQRAQSDYLKRSTSDGELVFHSHRHAFATAVLAKMDLKSAQMLTRHATAAMLTDTYAHSRLEKAAEGVELAIKSPLNRS